MGEEVSGFIYKVKNADGHYEIRGYRNAHRADYASFRSSIADLDVLWEADTTYLSNLPDNVGEQTFVAIVKSLTRQWQTNYVIAAPEVLPPAPAQIEPKRKSTKPRKS